MDAWLGDIVGQLPLTALFPIIAVSLVILVKGADILADQAVSLAVKWGVPTILIGATICLLYTSPSPRD